MTNKQKESRNGIDMAVELKVIEEQNKVRIKNVVDFDLDHIFDCGQCFRWEKETDGSYTGVAFGRVVRMEYEAGDDMLTIHNATAEDFRNIWYDYLDLGRDYDAIKKALAEKDPIICEAIEYGHGIRILNQEKWETLLSFIISQNNNIPRIKKCINSLAHVLGEKVGECDGKEYYSLPEPQVLAEASLDDLAPCRLGYRAKYLIETAIKVCQDGIESLERMGSCEISSSETCEALRKYCGVGPKVANCIALFAMGKFDSFPIDVWVRKVMHRLYDIDEGDMKAMAKFAKENFGEYGGIAQQYLFYYITHNNDAANLT